MFAYFFDACFFADEREVDAVMFYGVYYRLFCYVVDLECGVASCACSVTSLAVWFLEQVQRVGMYVFAAFS